MQPNSQAKGIYYGLSIVCVLLGLYLIVSAILTARNTGLLQLDTASTQAVLSVSQTNSQAKSVGTGSARVRLKPGVYQVSATLEDAQATSTVTIAAHHTIHAYLTPVSRPTPPSVENINFENTAALVDKGITTTQITALKQYFFSFKPTAKTVTIVTDSIQEGPRDTSSPNDDFTIDFTVTIDRTDYKAIISYSDLNDIRLRLYNTSTNALVFDSPTPAE